MLFLALGVAALFGLMLLLGKFSRTQVSTLKGMGVWVVLIGGVLLAAMLLLTGRGAAALGDIFMLAMFLGPWIKRQLVPNRAAGPRPAGPRAAGGASPPGRSGMAREEALAVLGLKPGADAATIREAHKRLMRMAHPDNGGSDWLASRLNQARDTLLG